MKRLTLLAIALAILSATGSHAQDPQAETQQWFREARFGMFIHWGVYSVLGDGEWVMNNREMTVEEYEKLPAQFNPVDYEPAEWVRLAKQAGMRYITITSKHHDGFAMWDSDVSNYNIVDATPYGKDVLKMLAVECEKQGIELFFYHSHLDWRHPDYHPRGKTGQHSGRPSSGDFDAYLDYMDAQVTELASGEYGALGGFWFDGWWDQHITEDDKADRSTHVDWRLKQTYDLIHRLQPQAIIGNNHHVLPFEGEGFQMFERDLPGQNTVGLQHDGDRKPPAGDMRHHQRLLGLQRFGSRLQELDSAYPLPGAHSGLRRELSLERRADAPGHLSTGGGRASRSDGRVDVRVR